MSAYVLMEYRTILRYRFMISLFPIDELCHVCCKMCLNIFGEHAVHCKELLDFKNKHDFVRDAFFDIYRRTRVSVKKEAHVNFLTNPLDKRSTPMPTDVMVYEWVRGKHAYVDLNDVSSLVGLAIRAFAVGHATQKDVSSKVVKHEKTCYNN